MVSSIRSCGVIKLIVPAEMYHAGGGFVARGYTRAMNVPLNGWSGEVERDILPLDYAEDCSGGLLSLGYDLQ